MLTKPTSQEEALRYLEEKQLMPTRLRTWQLEQLPVELRQRSFFSAAVTMTEVLDEALTQVKLIVAQDTDRAQARLAIRAILAKLNYTPEEGDEGTIKDLRTDQRQNLILDTNVAQANGYGEHQSQNDPDIHELYPALELYRAGGMPEQPRPWLEKWVRAGGKLYEGRMIAMRGDDIWTKNLDAGGFNRFGTEYPPFDFNSGMRTRNVARAEAERLGLAGLDVPSEQPTDVSINANTSAEPSIGSNALRQALLDSGLATLTNGRLTPTP